MLASESYGFQNASEEFLLSKVLHPRRHTGQAVSQDTKRLLGALGQEG